MTLRPMRFVALCWALVSVTLGACTDPERTEAIFVLPRVAGEEAFFDLPWPSDLRRTATGIDVTDFPNPNNVPLLERYRDAIMESVGGFSVSAPAYCRFAAALDESTLPADPAASIRDDASVFLINVDPESPELGQRHPSVTHFWDPQTEHWPGHTLAVRPVHGIPLRSLTTYALVVTDRVQALDGSMLGRSRDLDVVLGLRGASGDMERAAVALHALAVAALEDAGVPARSIVNLAVFTTQDATGELLSARDFVRAMEPPQPVLAESELVRTSENYMLIHGAYSSPIFQQGEVPYASEGGDIQFDADGNPVPVGSFEARFALTLPLTEMPATGWPLVLYAHGTGGDFQTFVNNGVADDLTQRGFAVMGVDQIHHGPRNPTSSGPEALVFNFTNPRAFRDNARQSALDVVVQARFARENPVDERIVGPGVFFDPAQTWFFGHSQGGLNGPLFLSIDDQARGGVLSGAGGHLAIALVDKVEPVNIPALAGFLLRWPGSEATRLEQEHFAYEHPILALLQTYTDVADPGNYAQLIFREPREGFAPKSILQTEGIEDPYTPPRAIEALALSMGAPPVEPLYYPDISGADVAGLTAITGPVQGNVAGGRATAGLLQQPGGHFVVFDDPLRTSVKRFFETALEGELPIIER